MGREPIGQRVGGTTKEYYFARMSVTPNQNDPEFVKSQWIGSGDVNVEHLLDVFTAIDASSDSVWRACACFMRHLYWHKNRLVILGSGFEGLPDDRSSKPACLSELSRLFDLVGNQVERERLLTCFLKLEREWGSDYQVARTLRHLDNADEYFKEGIQLAKEALRIGERLGDRVVQVQCLAVLARLFRKGEQIDAAEVASRATCLIPEEGEEYRLRRSHRALADVYQSKGKTGKSIHHL